MYSWLTKMENIPRWIVTIFIPLSIFVLAWLDYVTGYEVAFSVFYLLPVTLTAFFFKRAYGIFVAAVCSLLWGYINQTAGQKFSHEWILYWNDFTRFAYFAFTVILFCDLHEAIHKEKDLAMIDPLTGIYNRRMFYSEINREIARLKRFKRTFCVVYIDMDKFKYVNDTLGHAVGDEVIMTAAKVFALRTRENDVVARLGGDEFGIIMPETNLEQAEIVLPRLKDFLNNEMSSKGWPVTASIGVSVVEEMMTLDEIIDKADQVMFDVKKAGGNNVKFNRCAAKAQFAST